MKLSFIKLIHSLLYASRGIKYVLTQQNFFLMLMIAIGIIGLSCFLKISYVEWLIVILIIGLVLSLETINTTVERIMDFLESRRCEQVGLIKDLIAGAILIVCITALILGLIIFLPKIIALF